MHKSMKKVVATLLAAVTFAAPMTAVAEEAGQCDRYEQVESNATGGDYVGGILVYETTATVTRSAPTTTVTTSTSGTVGVPGTGGTSTVTTTTTQPGSTVSTPEPVGYYAMNDGSIYQINCVTGESTQLTHG